MGTLLLSRRCWSVHLVRGRPGGRFHVDFSISGADRPIARLGSSAIAGARVLSAKWIVLSPDRCASLESSRRAGTAGDAACGAGAGGGLDC